MSAKEYVKRTEELLIPILEEKGFDLWGVEFVKEGKEYYLRAYIDKDGGITINDCEDVSRLMNDILDREDYIREEYVFEVSSPGIERVLKTDRELNLSIGREVQLHTYKAYDKQKDFVGVLKKFDDDSYYIDMSGSDDEADWKQFDRKDTATIRLYSEF